MNFIPPCATLQLQLLATITLLPPYALAGFRFRRDPEAMLADLRKLNPEFTIEDFEMEDLNQNGLSDDDTLAARSRRSTEERPPLQRVEFGPHNYVDRNKYDVGSGSFDPYMIQNQPISLTIPILSNEPVDPEVKEAIDPVTRSPTDAIMQLKLKYDRDPGRARYDPSTGDFLEIEPPPRQPQYNPYENQHFPVWTEREQQQLQQLQRQHIQQQQQQQQQQYNNPQDFPITMTSDSQHHKRPKLLQEQQQQQPLLNQQQGFPNSQIIPVPMSSGGLPEQQKEQQQRLLQQQQQSIQLQQQQLIQQHQQQLLRQQQAQLIEQRKQQMIQEQQRQQQILQHKQRQQLFQQQQRQRLLHQQRLILQQKEQRRLEEEQIVQQQKQQQSQSPRQNQQLELYQQPLQSPLQQLPQSPRQHQEQPQSPRQQLQSPQQQPQSQQQEEYLRQQRPGTQTQQQQPQSPQQQRNQQQSQQLEVYQQQQEPQNLALRGNSELSNNGRQPIQKQQQPFPPFAELPRDPNRLPSFELTQPGKITTSFVPIVYPIRSGQRVPRSRYTFAIKTDLPEMFEGSGFPIISTLPESPTNGEGVVGDTPPPPYPEGAAVAMASMIASYPKSPVSEFTTNFQSNPLCDNGRSQNTSSPMCPQITLTQLTTPVVQQAAQFRPENSNNPQQIVRPWNNSPRPQIPLTPDINPQYSNNRPQIVRPWNYGPEPQSPVDATLPLMDRPQRAITPFLVSNRQMRNTQSSPEDIIEIGTQGTPINNQGSLNSPRSPFQMTGGPNNILERNRPQSALPLTGGQNDVPEVQNRPQSAFPMTRGPNDVLLVQNRPRSAFPMTRGPNDVPGVQNRQQSTPLMGSGIQFIPQLYIDSEIIPQYVSGTQNAPAMANDGQKTSREYSRSQSIPLPVSGTQNTRQQMTSKDQTTPHRYIRSQSMSQYVSGTQRTPQMTQNAPQVVNTPQNVPKLDNRGQNALQLVSGPKEPLETRNVPTRDMRRQSVPPWNYGAPQYIPQVTNDPQNLPKGYNHVQIASVSGSDPRPQITPLSNYGALDMTSQNMAQLWPNFQQSPPLQPERRQSTTYWTNYIAQPTGVQLWDTNPLNAPLWDHNRQPFPQLQQGFTPEVPRQLGQEQPVSTTSLLTTLLQHHQQHPFVFPSSDPDSQLIPKFTPPKRGRPAKVHTPKQKRVEAAIVPAPAGWSTNPNARTSQSNPFIQFTPRYPQSYGVAHPQPRTNATSTATSADEFQEPTPIQRYTPGPSYFNNPTAESGLSLGRSSTALDPARSQSVPVTSYSQSRPIINGALGSGGQYTSNNDAQEQQQSPYNDPIPQFGSFGKPRVSSAPDFAQRSTPTETSYQETRQTAILPEYRGPVSFYSAADVDGHYRRMFENNETKAHNEFENDTSLLQFYLQRAQQILQEHSTVNNEGSTSPSRRSKQQNRQTSPSASGIGPKTRRRTTSNVRTSPSRARSDKSVPLSVSIPVSASVPVPVSEPVPEPVPLQQLQPGRGIPNEPIPGQSTTNAMASTGVSDLEPEHTNSLSPTPINLNSNSNSPPPSTYGYANLSTNPSISTIVNGAKRVKRDKAGLGLDYYVPEFY